MNMEARKKATRSEILNDLQTLSVGYVGRIGDWKIKKIGDDTYALYSPWSKKKISTLSAEGASNVLSAQLIYYGGADEVTSNSDR